MPSGILIAGVAVVALIVGIIIFILSRVVTVPPSKALIISGAKQDGETKVVRQGGRTFIIPVLQSAQEISLSQKTIPLVVDGVDLNSVEVKVAAVAIIKVGSTEDKIRAAAERFLEAEDDTDNVIARNTQQVLVGALRAIISQMTIGDLISKRETLQTKVLEIVKTELASMGLETESLQISEITDPNGYIKALGVPETERVRKDARIAKAINDQEANDQEVASQKLISEKNRDLEIRKSELQAEIDRQAAESEAAGPLVKAEKDRQIAEIGRAAAEARAELREKELDTEVRKPADAERYARVQAAEAAKSEAVLNAQADAESTKLSSAASAEATKITGLAEAKAVKARGIAEAEAMEKKADAFKSYNDAAVVQLIVDKLPEIARELAQPISNIKDLSIISTEGATALPKTVANNFGQLDEVLKKSAGVSISDLLSSFVNRKGDAPAIGGIENDKPVK